MKVRTAIVVTAAAFALGSTCSGAAADPATNSGTGDDNLWIGMTAGTSTTPGTTTHHGVESGTEPAALDTNDCGALGGTYTLIDPDLHVCAIVPEANQITIGMLRTAFTRLKLPTPNLTIQPLDHRTLVNFDTNFYSTTIQQPTHRVRLLGQPVAIKATPSTYTWSFGDDTTITTSHAGAPYPDLLVTHNYLRTATYGVSLAIAWTGEYRLGNGPWQQIPGTVTTTSPTQHLTAIEAEPKLVDPYGS